MIRRPCKCVSNLNIHVGPKSLVIVSIRKRLIALERKVDEALKHLSSSASQAAAVAAAAAAAAAVMSNNTSPLPARSSSTGLPAALVSELDEKKSLEVDYSPPSPTFQSTAA